MHAIGENIVYGGGGVMTVVDVREEMIGDEARKYYVLRPAAVRSESLTFVPVDNEKLVSLMRPLLTRDEVVEVIRSAADEPDCDWPADNRSRSELFKKILESGDRVKTIAMIRTIYRAGQRREEEGKKNYLADENAMRKAEKLIHSEFSLVLDIPEEDVPAFIEKEYNKIKA